MNKTKATAILFMMSIIVALVLVEIGARLLGVEPREAIEAENGTLGFQNTWGQLDDRYGWMNRAGRYPTDFDTMTFGDDGIRNSGANHDKTEKDMVVVGGSNTQGYQARDEIIFASQLDYMFPRVRVLNYASGGWGTYQSYLRAIDLLAADKDRSIKLVLYGLYSDHRRRNIARHDWIYALADSRGRNFIPPHVLSLMGDDLTPRPASIVDLWPFETSSIVVTLAHRAYLFTMNPPRSSTHMYKVMNAILQKMKQATDRHGADLLVVFIDAPEPLLLGWLKDAGIEAIVCNNEDWHDPAYRLQGRGYPNGLQHSFWANCIADKLEERGWERVDYQVPDDG